MATAALVLGILSIPLCFLFIPGVLALVFGFIALSQTKASGQKGRGFALTGIILGGISVAFIALAIVFAGTIDIDTASVLIR
ncbi:MAG: DUF4190 domain-containing protein [Ilumatobacter sp.]|nr:DUF4190 domain-containing protein [Ilumatobacter sp.]